MSTADDALKEWAHRRHMHTNVPRPVEAAFMFAYRRALEDAADALHYPGNEKSTDGIYEKWLRDRAAGVGTKDGDGDA